MPNLLWIRITLTYNAALTKLSSQNLLIKPKNNPQPQPKQNSDPVGIGKKPVIVEVNENHDGQRLDNFLISLLKGVPKTHIYRIIRKGEVRVNKGRAKQITRLKTGDLVRVPPIRTANNSAKTIDRKQFQFLQDAILFEDDALLVLNKPSGMAVHAGSGIAVGVIEAMRGLREDLAYIELAHRLDRDTSGCLVLAKKASVLRQLNHDFAANSDANKLLDKRYLTLVKGKWQHGQRKVIKPLDTEARRGGERHVIVSSQGSYASSIMTPLKRGAVASLLEVKLLTGRTHQVRVHALAEGHPVAGDSRYGDTEFNTTLKQSYGLKRLFLHAFKITLNHPISSVPVTFEAPLPLELQAVLEALKLQAL